MSNACICMLNVLSVVNRSQGKMPSSLVEGVLMESEASVMATFDFIGGENVVDDDDENLRYENELPVMERMAVNHFKTLCFRALSQITCSAPDKK